MTRRRIFAICTVAGLLVAGCSDSRSSETNTREPSPAAQASASASATAASGQPMVIPPEVPGELGRVVFQDGRVEGSIERSASKGPYATRAACSASAPRAWVKFEVTSAEPSRSSEPPISVGEITCDGSVSENSGFTLRGRVQLRFVDLDDEVTAAYVLFYPASAQ